MVVVEDSKPYMSLHLTENRADSSIVERCFSHWYPIWQPNLSASQPVVEESNFPQFSTKKMFGHDRVMTKHGSNRSSNISMAGQYDRAQPDAELNGKNHREPRKRVKVFRLQTPMQTKAPEPREHAA